MTRRETETHACSHTSHLKRPCNVENTRSSKMQIKTSFEQAQRFKKKYLKVIL